ncbi:MAG: TatD family hydrolase [Chlamydiales bacterium]
MLIDAHAHLTTASLESDLESILARAQKNGIEAIVNICTNPQELEKGVQLAQVHPWIYNVASTTPHDAEKQGDEHFDFMASYARSKQIVAIGETGLDYYYYRDTAPIQQALLSRYLHLARECSLPVVIHCRDAFTDLFRILDKEGKGVTTVLHCFTGDMEEAQEVIERGWYLSLSGIVTFKKSEVLREVAKIVPSSQLLIETDTPYLAPFPYRGKRNEPAYLKEIAKLIAELRHVSYEDLAQTTAENTRTLFQLNRQ